MGSVLYEIAPDGDMEIILTNSNTRDIHSNAIAHRQCPGGFKSEDKGAYKPRPALANNGFKSENEGDNNGFYEDFHSIMADLYMAFYNSPNPSRSDKKDVVIRMRVSSSHLALASSFFKREIEAFQEVNAFMSLDIVLNSLDARVLAVALNVIHGRHRQVPRRVDLPFLASIAAFAEVYDYVEALQFTTEVWHAAIYTKGHLLNKYCLMWMYSSWVFSWSKSFSEMLQVVITHYEGPEHIQLNNLPLGGILGTKPRTSHTVMLN